MAYEVMYHPGERLRLFEERKVTAFLEGDEPSREQPPPERELVFGLHHPVGGAVDHQRGRPDVGEGGESRAVAERQELGDRRLAVHDESKVAGRLFGDSAHGRHGGGEERDQKDGEGQ